MDGQMREGKMDKVVVDECVVLTVVSGSTSKR